MDYINISLEELEYLLITNKCEYIFGFPDMFIKTDRSIINKKFDLIADELENKKIISRTFKGEINYDEKIKKVLECIKNVEKYYDITIIDSNKVSKKYRIYYYKNEYVLIEILSNGNSNLDYSNIYIYKLSLEKIIERAKNNINKLFIGCIKKLDNNIQISTDLYKSINKISEEKFISKYKNIAEDDTLLLKNIYKTITYAEKILSISITDMSKRKSNIYMYVSGLKSLLRMELKIEKDNYHWDVKQIDNTVFDEEINKVFMNRGK